MDSFAGLRLSSLEQRLLAAAGVCGLILLYLYIAAIQSETNYNIANSDQGAYMEFGKRAHSTGFRYTGGRARMPLFPWLTALLYSPEMSDEEYFEAGKQFNTLLSLAILLALAKMFLDRFSRLYACYAVLSIAFMAFVLKAPWFQAELLYYGLFAFGFIFALSALAAPTWRKSLTVGLFLGLAHFAKASALPAMILFCFSLGIACIVGVLRRQIQPGDAIRSGAQALLALFVYLTLLFPYLQESHERYGSHFYNVNTTFYTWYDSWSEVKAGTRAAGDRLGYPDLPADEIPTLQKYLSEHTLQQVVDRFVGGARRILHFGCVLRDSSLRYGYCSQVAAGLVMLTFGFALLLRRFGAIQLLASGHIIFFPLAVFFIYAMGAFWFSATMGVDPRHILVLIVPFFWVLGLVVHSPPVQEHRLRFGNLLVNTFQLVYVLLSISLVVEVFLLATGRAATLYGGS